MANLDTFSVGASELRRDGPHVQELSFDLVVVGGTPGGIAAAVRAAREGQSVLLTERSARVGGMLTGGLGVMDTQYEGRRAPIYDELSERVLEHYRERFGEESPQYRNVVPRKKWPLTAEPHVMQHILERMLRDEPKIRLASHCQPTAVVRVGRLIRAVELARAPSGQSERLIVGASTYIDATYEGELLALVGEEYRIGREDRNEFDEPHAGRFRTRQVLTEDGTAAWPRAALDGGIHLRGFKSVTQEVLAGSTGEGDTAVQAYSYRLCLCSDPANRRMPEMPPDYRPERYRAYAPHRGIGEPNLPNEKRFWFRNLAGANWQYPDGSEIVRDRIRSEYRNHALGYLYFLQHDESVPEAIRNEYAVWGLARDEFVDNDNFPYELYVREARRLVGRHVFTEHDASIGRGIARTPVHGDGIAFGEWPLDSHEVSEERELGGCGEGKFLLTELTRPSQIPYRCLLPKRLDNLLVPVCLSASHVGWGTLRLEPVWMHLGEVAGHAAVLARASGSNVGDLDVGSLQLRLLSARCVTSYFDDLELGSSAADVIAICFFCTQGFFDDYQAALDLPLSRSVGTIWLQAALDIVAGDNDPMRTARRVAAAKRHDALEPLTWQQLVIALDAAATLRDLAQAKAIALAATNWADRRGIPTTGSVAEALLELVHGLRHELTGVESQVGDIKGGSR